MLDKKLKRKRRATKTRAKIRQLGVPRLCVGRTSKHIYAQIIDDMKAVTLVSASTLDKEFDLESTGNIEAAKKVGELVAKRALEKGIKKVVFDRGGYLYHGRVKALADAAREAGLEF